MGHGKRKYEEPKVHPEDKIQRHRSLRIGVGRSDWDQVGNDMGPDLSWMDRREGSDCKGRAN